MAAIASSAAAPTAASAPESEEVAGEEHLNNHALIAPSARLSLEQQLALSKMQARFRGGRDRDTHVSRARAGLPTCPFVRTPLRAVAAMIELGRIEDTDVVYDLGCGDGAICFGVARACRARCVGFDIDEVHLSTARRQAAAAGISKEQIDFRCDDVLELDLSPASVLVMFLVPNMLEALMEKFRRMTEGTRILSFHFPLPVWQPEETRVVDHPHHPPPATTNMYSYTVGVRATSSSTSDTG